MKPIYKSKTLGVAILNMVALKFIPGAKEFVQNNPEIYGEILTLIMIILRLLTYKAIK